MSRCSWISSLSFTELYCATSSLIGYNSLNGEIPGCYSYDGFVTIQVKVVYDYDFAIEHKVRIVGDADKTWKDTVDAKVGDKVEFSIQYKNTSDCSQKGVVIKDTLQYSLRYIEGSTMFKNGNYPNGTEVINDDLVGEGLRIGSYGSNSNAYLKLTAEVVDNGNLGYGTNALINWVQAGVGATTRSDDASVIVSKDQTFIIIATILLSLMLLCFIGIIL